MAIAVTSALFTYYQVEIARDQVIIARDALELTREQADAANDMLSQEVTTVDLAFVGKLGVSLDEAGESIRIANYSDFPLTSSLVWTLGITSQQDGHSRLDTVRAPLAGLGACRTMTVSVAELRNSVALDNSKHDPEEVQGVTGHATIEEVFLTFRAPSGDWYTISENVSYERVEGDPATADEAASHTPADQILGDTVAEGVDQSVYFKPNFPIGPRTPVSDGAYAIGNAKVDSNSCIGP